jgi:hypothetical protein
MMAKARKIVHLLASAAAGCTCWMAPALTLGSLGLGVGMTLSPVMAQASEEKDTLILRSGNIVKGKVIEEKADEIIFEVDVAGIKSKTSYKRAEILAVNKAAASGETPAAPASGEPAGKTAPAPAAAANEGAQKVYFLELEGWFGEDISQTPIRQAMADAKKNEVDYIIISINNDWSMERFGDLGDIKDDVGQFDQFWRALEIDPIFGHEIPQWPKAPKVVFWVKKAMGGAAFLPLGCKDIYFASEGKMGGIGHLDKMFGSTGDEVVRQKQYSLRVVTAQGIAIRAGHDPKLVKAMAEDEYILSVKYEGGAPVYLERMPESPDEELLTDDAKDERRDDIVKLARGEGNDCLTLTAEKAQRLGVSKGTVDTLDDLLFQLGIARNHQIVNGQAKNIQKTWISGLESAKRRLQKLWEDYGEVEVAAPGEYPQRTQARGRQKSIINEMQALLTRYKEAINANQIEVPDYNQLEEMKRLIELDQLRDKP